VYAVHLHRHKEEVGRRTDSAADNSGKAQVGVPDGYSLLKQSTLSFQTQLTLERDWLLVGVAVETTSGSALHCSTRLSLLGYIGRSVRGAGRVD